MSESADDRQSEDQPSGQRPGPSDGNHSPGSQSPGKQSQSRQAKPAGDPVADFQRWLMRAGARSMANQVADNVRRTLGQQKRTSKNSGDVWDTATTEPPPDEPPECQWCPVCQAARRLRESGPGLSAKIADAGGLLTALAQDAFSAVDQIMKTQNLSNERPGARPQAPAPSNGASPSADPGGRPPGTPRSEGASAPQTPHQGDAIPPDPPGPPGHQ